MPATVDLTAVDLRVMPGDAVSTTIRLANTGRIVDELSLEVLGDAAPWTTIDPPRVPLFPNAHAEATITFRPPRTGAPPAGIIPFGIRVRSREDRTFSFVAEGRLQIGALMDVGAHLAPRSSVASRMGQGARHRVEVMNNSNTVARVRVTAADADERLTFRVAQPLLTIPAGGSAVTAITVKGRSRMLTGAQTVLPFQVSVAPDGAPPIVLDGSMLQRATLIGGATQVLTLAVVVGLGALVATQALPLLSPAAATPAPTIAPPSATTAAASVPTAAPPQTAAPTEPPTLPPPTETAPPTEAPTATPEPTAPPPTATPVPSATASPTAAPPLSIRILNLGLVDPQGAIPEQTPTPPPTPQPTAGPGFSPPIHVFPSFPIRLMSNGSGSTSGGAIAAIRGAFTQDQQPGLPVQQFGIQVTGPVAAEITRVSDNTAPKLCLVPASGGDEQCLETNRPLAGQPPGSDAETWFLSVVAQQGGSAVDVKIDYAPQPVVFGFKDLHLAGVSATPGVHLVIQASGSGIIEIITQVNLAADVTVSVRDLNTQVAAPPSTTPAGLTSAPFIAAAEPGHLYDILLTSTSQDEVFVSGTISWP